MPCISIRMHTRLAISWRPLGPWEHSPKPSPTSLPRAIPTDDAGTAFDAITLDVGAGETVHFNSDDLETAQLRQGTVRWRRPRHGAGA